MKEKLEQLLQLLKDKQSSISRGYPEHISWEINLLREIISSIEVENDVHRILEQ